MLKTKEGNKIETSTLAKDNTSLFEIAPSRHKDFQKMSQIPLSYEPERVKGTHTGIGNLQFWIFVPLWV